jgi:hypothetical protein
VDRAREYQTKITLCQRLTPCPCQTGGILAQLRQREPAFKSERKARDSIVKTCLWGFRDSHRPPFFACGGHLDIHRCAGVGRGLVGCEYSLGPAKGCARLLLKELLLLDYNRLGGVVGR